MKSLEPADKDESNVDSSSVVEECGNSPKRKKKHDTKKVFFSNKTERKSYSNYSESNAQK